MRASIRVATKPKLVHNDRSFPPLTAHINAFTRKLERAKLLAALYKERYHKCTTQLQESQGLVEDLRMEVHRVGTVYGAHCTCESASYLEWLA